MPTVTMEIYPGRTIEQKRAMVKKVTEALVETINCKPEAVKIIIREVSKENISDNGVLHCDKI